MVKEGNRAVTEVLVQWQDYEEAGNTWEGYKLKERFPDFNLEDKVFLRGPVCNEHGGWPRVAGDSIKVS